MKPAVEVSITSWKKNVVKPGQEYGRVLLMPGTGYNCDRPLLYWSAQALVEAGWRIDRMNVRNASDDLSTVIPVLNQAIDGWMAAARESGAGKAGDSGDGVAADDSATVLADGAAGSPNRDSDTPSGPRLLLDWQVADDDDLPTCGLTLRSAVRAADPGAASRRLRSIPPG